CFLSAPPTPVSYTLSLHDALPILKLTAKGTDEGAGSTTPLPTSSKSSTSTKSTVSSSDSTARGLGVAGLVVGVLGLAAAAFAVRSEEHTSELQSRFDLVCRLLLEK